MIRHLYTRGLLTSFLFAVILMVGTCTAVKVAMAHSEAITECRNNIIYTEAVKLFEDFDGSFVTEGYDTNSDGQMDVMALSNVTGRMQQGENVIYQHDPNPLFWMVDRQEFDTTGDGLPDTVEHDGNPDTVFVDIGGEGNCDDIKFYKDLRIPRGPDFDTLPEAEV